MPTPYSELIEQIIEKQSTVLGLPVAVRRARNVPGLEIDDAGKVISLSPNTIPVLEALVAQYKALSGSMGVDLCRQVAMSSRLNHPDLQLPTVLS